MRKYVVVDPDNLNIINDTMIITNILYNKNLKMYYVG